MNFDSVDFQKAEVTSDAGNINSDFDLQDVVVTWSATQFAQHVIPLRLEVTQSRGFSGISLLGGTGQICEDGKERAKAALERLGWVTPAQKILMSVSPGDVKIDKTHLDLAFCVGLAGVLELGQWVIAIDKWMFAAEVGINGELRPVAGTVAWASAAMNLGLHGIVVAEENIEELRCLAAIVAKDNPDFLSLGFKTLQDVLEWLTTGKGAEQKKNHSFSIYSTDVDFDDMDLSPTMQMVALVAASGMHSVLMRGSPGTGKSMFAKRLASILPLMSAEEHLYALGLHSSISAKVANSILAGIPPFRSPHHYTSVSALLGTANLPGELALASGGVLFLDEFPEFRRDVLEGLREPMETGEVMVSRAKGNRSWQAKVLLIAAANNCPCGWSASKRRRCECSTARLVAYRNRLSGPLLDRIDLHINMEEPQSQFDSLFGSTGLVKTTTEITKGLREKVLMCRERALSREKLTGCRLNRDIPPRLVIETFGVRSDVGVQMVEKIVPKHASARSLIRCLRVARTIADVEESDQVQSRHIDMAWSWQAWSAAKQRGEILPIQ